MMKIYEKICLICFLYKKHKNMSKNLVFYTIFNKNVQFLPWKKNYKKNTSIFLTLKIIF